jgi:hypothetical protein
MRPTRLTVITLLCAATVARAEDPAPAAAETAPPASEPAAASIEAPAAQPAPEPAPPPVEVPVHHHHDPLHRKFKTSSFGPMLSLGIGSGLSGDYLVGELGFQMFGVRELSREWIVYWDAAIAFRTGGLGNEHPYFFFAGGSAHGIGELGRRFFANNPWSPYLSVRGQGHISLMADPSVGMLDTINDSAGFGGLVADASLRVSAGASYLDSRHLFVVTIFAQEQLRGPEGITSGDAFTEAGLSVRYDIADSFAIYVEGIYGAAPATFRPGLNTRDSTSRMEASGFLRKLFHNGIWLALAVSYGRDTDTLSYDGGGTFFSANPPDFAVTASFGVPIGVRP